MTLYSLNNLSHLREYSGYLAVVELGEKILGYRVLQWSETLRYSTV